MNSDSWNYIGIGSGPSLRMESQCPGIHGSRCWCDKFSKTKSWRIVEHLAWPFFEVAQCDETTRNWIRTSRLDRINCERPNRGVLIEWHSSPSETCSSSKVEGEECDDQQKSTIYDLLHIALLTFWWLPAKARTPYQKMRGAMCNSLVFESFHVTLFGNFIFRKWQLCAI